MSERYLPTWATAQEASEWLESETGQKWPLVRLLESVHKLSVWIDCRDDEPEHVIEGLFQGRLEGFRAEVIFGSDIERLKFVRDGGTLHISRRPDGTLVRFTPPIKFPIDDLRFEADCLRRVAAVVRETLPLPHPIQQADATASTPGPDCTRITIAEAKRQILEASPRELFTDFYEGADGELTTITDGVPKSIFAVHLDEDFAENCEKLGIVPSGKYRPGKTGYAGDSTTDDLYTITRGELARLAALYGVPCAARVPPPHFITSARPLEVPAALLALPDDAQVSYEHNIARQRRSGITNAADYREEISDTMARQAKGHFTLNEAAQVLADCRPGLDPREAVRRFRLAHSKGELPIHQHGSHFPLDVDETIRDFLDTVEVSEVDAWLRASVGYCFPAADSVAATPKETAKQRRARLLEWFEQEEAKGPKRGALARVVAREKLIRPTADRSNIGKDIKQARKERAAARRAGPFDALCS